MKKKKFKSISSMILIIIIVVIGILIAWQQGLINFNQRKSEEYSIKGVDVSEYQGEIDWKILAKQGIQFAFIKATEGSRYVDPYFQKNWKEAQTTKLAIGAYHFFSYDSSGKDQATNVIKNVTPIEEMLPPVIDVEFYGEKEWKLPEKEKTKKELQDMIEELTNYYGKTPIIYATQKSYHLYIEEDFTQCPIWIRNVFTKPKLEKEREWSFWQYSDKGKLEGYQGKEKYIDLNVFQGKEEEFKQYLNK